MGQRYHDCIACMNKDTVLPTSLLSARPERLGAGVECLYGNHHHALLTTSDPCRPTSQPRCLAALAYSARVHYRHVVFHASPTHPTVEGPDSQS